MNAKEQAQELNAQMERFKAMGLDINAIQAAAQATYGDSTTPLGLNQWKSTDKPTMADFNRDNEIIDREIRALREELANKVDGKYRIYNSLEQMGINVGEETLETIAKSMRDNSMLIYLANSGTNQQEYPTMNGTVQVVKKMNGRVFCTFISSDPNPRSWYGSFNSSNNTFTGWRLHATV